MQKAGKKGAASPRGSRGAANNHKASAAAAAAAAAALEEDEDIFEDEEDDEEDIFEEDDLPGSKARGKWAAEEDELLREAVQTHGGRNWKRISEILVGRTDVQCLHRW